MENSEEESERKNITWKRVIKIFCKDGRKIILIMLMMLEE